MKTFIFYHANCADGMAAAYAAWFGLMGNLGGVSYVPCIHDSGNWLTPDVTGAEVFFVDFCPPKNDIITMCSIAQRVTILDHHATAQDNFKEQGWYPANLRVRFDMTRSGAEISWDFFNEGLAPGPLFPYVADRDLWKWALPDSKAINAYIALHPFTLEHYDDLDDKLRHGFAECLTAGESILMYQKKLVDMAVAQCWTAVDSNNLMYVTGNTTVLQSEIGSALLAAWPKALYSCTYMDDHKLGTRVWSLRSRKDFDVSVIAKRCGGGGHAQAAGFTTSMTCACPL